MNVRTNKKSIRTAAFKAIEALESRQLFSGGTLVPGAIVHGTIDTVGAADVWTFDAHHGDTVQFGLTSTKLSSTYSSRAELYRPGLNPGELGGRVAVFSATGAKPFTLDTDGTYTLVVHDNNDKDTGIYDLAFEGINPISPDAAPLSNGGIVAGSIDSALDVKEFTFTVPANASVRLGLTSTKVTSTFSARAYVYAPGSATSLMTFSAGEQPVKTLTAPGTYMVMVRDSNGNDQGSFTLGWEMVNPISPDPTPLVVGGIVGGSLDSALDVKQFVFDVDAGSTIQLGLTSTKIDSTFSARAELFAPNSATPLKVFSASELPPLTLTTGGQYMLMVHDANFNDRGTFTLGLEGINPISPDATPVPSGGIVNGSIASPLDVEQFTFNVGAGSTVQIGLTSTKIDSTFGARAELFAPNSATALKVFSAGETAPMLLTQPGTYMIMVHDANYSDRGTFTLGLEGVNPISADALQLKPGGIVKGAIGGAIDIDEYTFNATAGDIIGLLATSTKITSTFSARFDVFGPTGGSAGQINLGSAQNTFHIAQTGTYMVMVHDANYNDQGTYSIGLEGISKPSPDAKVLPSGTARVGTIDSPIGIDQYVLDLRKGETLRFSLASTANQNGFSARAQIFGVLGVSQMWFGPGTSTFTVPTSGQYIVQVADSMYSRVGQYTLAATWVAPAYGGISGTLFSDANGNRKRESGDAGIAHAKVFIDANNNGVLDSTERTAQTDEDGVYAFTRLRAGSYVVRALTSDGFAPFSTKSITVKLKNGQNAGSVNFGAVPKPTISGSLFRDDNGNGALDDALAENTLYGWTVYLDSNNDGVLNDGESFTTTDRFGRWSFSNLPDGEYAVRVAVTGPWQVSTPVGESAQVQILGGRSNLGNVFGVKPIGVLA
jgi:hypothetical protein